MKRAMILALAGVAFAHTDGRSGDVNSSSVLYSPIIAADNCGAITTSASDSTTSIINPLTMVINTTHRAPTGSNATGTITSVVGLSMVANSVAVTSTADISSTAATEFVKITGIRAVGTGGISMPNASAIAGLPVLGDGVMNGVSIGLFIVSVGLTALLQM